MSNLYVYIFERKEEGGGADTRNTPTRNIERLGAYAWRGRRRVEKEREILGTQFHKILNRPARRRLIRPRVSWLLY